MAKDPYTPPPSGNARRRLLNRQRMMTDGGEKHEKNHCLEFVSPGVPPVASQEDAQVRSPPTDPVETPRAPPPRPIAAAVSTSPTRGPLVRSPREQLRPVPRDDERLHGENEVTRGPHPVQIAS